MKVPIFTGPHFYSSQFDQVRGNRVELTTFTMDSHCHANLASCPHLQESLPAAPAASAEFKAEFIC